MCCIVLRKSIMILNDSTYFQTSQSQRIAIMTPFLKQTIRSVACGVSTFWHTRTQLDELAESCKIAKKNDLK